ncbi:MAG: PKD domain-containing protein [Candidatus Hermodarchaeia archaeon]
MIKHTFPIGFGDASNEIFLQILPEDDQPIADFTSSPTHGNAPLDVSFTENATSYDGIVNWEWDFDSDTVVDSMEPNPTYRYDQPGLYTVSLTVYDADGDNDMETKIDYININWPPIADASGPYTAEEGVTITFDGSGSYDPDGDIVSYSWDFDNDSVVDSTVPSPTHTYARNGTYPVTLTVIDNDSATDADATAATGFTDLRT